LTAGKATSGEVKDDLLGIIEKGSQWHSEFVDECKEDPARFERPIKRRKIMNFSYDAAKVKVTAKDQTMKEIRCTRDLFGRILFLAASKNIDLATVLLYP